MTITRRLQIDIGLLGLDIIAQMTDRERDKFHGLLDQRQEYVGRIYLNGEEFELGIHRRGEKATVLIKPPETGNHFIVTEEEDFVAILIPKRMPAILADGLEGKPASAVAGSFDNLPIFDKLIIQSVETTGNYLNLKTRTTWQDYQADYVRKENW